MPANVCTLVSPTRGYQGRLSRQSRVRGRATKSSEPYHGMQITSATAPSFGFVILQGVPQAFPVVSPSGHRQHNSDVSRWLVGRESLAATLKGAEESVERRSKADIWSAAQTLNDRRGLGWTGRSTWLASIYTEGSRTTTGLYYLLQMRVLYTAFHTGARPRRQRELCSSRET